MTTTHAGHDHPATPAARAACRRAAAAPTVRTRTMPEGTHTDGCGFPLRPCDRCGGEGYGSRYGSRCFGCGGTGHVDYNKSSRTQRLAHQAARRVSTPVAELAIGHRVWTSITTTTMNTSVMTGVVDSLEPLIVSTRVGPITYDASIPSIDRFVPADPAPYLARIKY